MTAGLPGTGIGGIFYVVTALAMPLREAAHAFRRRRDPQAPAPRWRAAVRQASLALGILAGIALAGWLVVAFVPGAAAAVAGHVGGGGETLPAGNLVRAGALLLSLGTLTGVVVGVELASLVRRRRPVRADHEVLREAP